MADNSNIIQGYFICAREIMFGQLENNKPNNMYEWM